MEEIKEMDTRQSLKVVTSNSFITAKGMENISLKARKLLYLTTAQIQLGDTEFFEYKIKASEFAELMGISASHVYEEADKITDELMKLYISVVPEGKKKFKKYHVIRTCEYDDEAYLKVKIDDEMLGFFVGLKKNFSKPELFDFLKMNSNYSIEIWHLMQREMKSAKPATRRIEFYLSLEELRAVTGTTNVKTYDILNNFKQRILNKALREIKDNCAVDITYTNKKKGRTVIGFDFVAINEYGIDLTDWEKENPEKAELVKKKSRKLHLLKLAKERQLTVAEDDELQALILELDQFTLFD